MPDKRPPTPDPVKRILRQNAGFGCCVCGKPVYQYHHIVPWEVEHHFRPEDMMLLCPYDHDAATKGALTEAKQRAWQARPFNRRRGYASGALVLNQGYSAIRTGGVLLVGDGSILEVDDVPLLSLGTGEDGEVLLSVQLADAAGGILAVIDKNEWIAGDSAVFDIRSDHQILTINSAPNKIAFNLRAKKEPLELRAKLWWKSRLIELNPQGLFFGEGSNRRSNAFLDLGFVGARFKVNTAVSGLQITPYMPGGFVMVSEADPVLRFRKSVECWKAMQSGRS